MHKKTLVASMLSLSFYGHFNIGMLVQCDAQESQLLSPVVRKPAYCIIYAKKKDADQLCGDREADQRLCFRYTDSTIPHFLNPKFQASRHLL